jgi:surface protein
MKVSAAADATKRESALLAVNGEDTPTYAVSVLSGAISYTGTNAAAFANATYTVEPNVTTVSVYSKPTGPIVTGIATQFASATVGTGATSSGLIYANWASTTPGVHVAHYRLRFSNGMVSNLSIYSDSPQGLTNPTIRFALSNIPASGVTAILQGRNNAYAGNVWYDVNVPTRFITPSDTIIDIGGTTNQFAASPTITADTVMVASATVTTPGTIALAIPYTFSDVGVGQTFYVVANANTRAKQSAASVAQTLAGAVKVSEPVYTLVSPGSYTASMTYAVTSISGVVTSVEVRRASDNTIVSGATHSISLFTATITVPFTGVAPFNFVVIAKINSSLLPASAQQSLLAQFTTPTFNSVTYSGTTATMTYNVATGVTAVQVRKVSDNSVLTTGVTTSVSGNTATINVTLTENVTIVVVALGNASGLESLASAQQTLLARFPAPTLKSVTYSAYDASKTSAEIKYDVATGVTGVMGLFLDSWGDYDNIATRPGFNSNISVNTTTRIATITLLFDTAAGLTIKVIALGNLNGRASVDPNQNGFYIDFPGHETVTLSSGFVLSIASNQTIKYIGNPTDVPTSTPRFIEANLRGSMEWFAVVKQDMKTAITNYESNNVPFRRTSTDPATVVPLNNVVTTLMTDMSYLFSGKTTFNQPIASWDTIAVTNMIYMFNNANAFNQPISKWNTSAVANMSYMFNDAQVFNQPIGAWNTSAVTNMNNMFRNASAFNQPIGEWNTSAVTNMSSMFNNADAFNQPIDAWNTGAVMTMQSMFSSCYAFNQPIGAWNTSVVTNMVDMFFSTSAFNQPIGTWNTSAVRDMTRMFCDASAFNQNISAWNVSNVITKPPLSFSAGSPLTAQNSPVWVTPIVLDGTTIKYIGFAEHVPTSAPLFIQANLRGTGMEWFAVVKQGMKTAITNYASGPNSPFIYPGQSVPVIWNNIVTTLMTDMSNLFQSNAFNEPIASWDTSNVTNMSVMFWGLFNQPIGTWNTSNVTSMASMFSGAGAFNQPIGTWNTSNVTRMDLMFYGASAFNATIGTWNTSKVNYVAFMFHNAIAFNQPIGAWNTGAITNMSLMFTGAIAFNQPIGSWNTSAVTAMQQVFDGATAFNQPIGTWNTSLVTTMDKMYYNASVFNQNISAWNVANVIVKPPTDFSTGSPLTAQNSPVWVTTPIVQDGTTFKYIGDPTVVPTSTPLYIYANPTGSGMQWYAVVKQGMKTAISTYATSAATSFTPPGESSPVVLARIVTTLMTDMSSLFNNRDTVFSNLPKQYVNSWDTSNVTSMVSMFKDNGQFGSAGGTNIGSWNTANVTNMSEMFMNVTSTFSSTIGSWNTAKVNNMAYMFSGATKFNQGIGSWNTSAVLNMAGIFQNASMFNQNISGWDVDQVTAYLSFRTGSALSDANTPPMFINAF